MLEVELQSFRCEPYAGLVTRIDGPTYSREQVGRGGTRYQIKVRCYWDDREGGPVRVIGSIDDGGWRAFAPMTRAFIKAPDESLAD